ncbi:unnamed protein product [Cladocopium goreaui]|uniref:Uncharacterized protein n=1 Tax=Cladocopium goreaui TaxID=2562237 RepID=A0A9P1DD55_9DINO|nr:unnamed protein product [Cladocopium goreaui]
MASAEENEDDDGDEIREDAISIAQVVQGQTFFNVNKNDRVLTKLTTGRGLNRHAAKSNDMCKKQFWHNMQVARREACNAAYAQVQRHAMEAAGEVVPDNHKFRAARNGDQFFVKGGAVEVQLEGMTVLTTFAVKGDLFFRLDTQTVRQVIAAIRGSPDIVIGSPKRKRRRKRKGGSLTPQRKNCQEEPEEDAAGEAETSE